jgi:thioredoxin-related protein
MKMCILAVMLMINGFGYSQEWTPDLDVALSKANSEDKLVLLFFSVPEACNICEKLQKNVMESDEFKSYARENYILAKPDFDGSVPMEKKADNLLIVEKYNKDGFFPLVVVLDKNAKVIGKAGIYNDETPGQYLKQLTSIGK